MSRLTSTKNRGGRGNKKISIQNTNREVKCALERGGSSFSVVSINPSKKETEGRGNLGDQIGVILFGLS